MTIKHAVKGSFRCTKTTTIIILADAEPKHEEKICLCYSYAFFTLFFVLLSGNKYIYILCSSANHVLLFSLLNTYLHESYKNNLRKHFLNFLLTPPLIYYLYNIPISIVWFQIIDHTTHTSSQRSSFTWNRSNKVRKYGFLLWFCCWEFWHIRYASTIYVAERKERVWTCFYSYST